MAKTNRRVVPVGTYNAGVYQMPSIDIGQESSSFEIAIDVSAFPITTSVVAFLMIEGSDDAGATWQQLITGTLIGDNTGRDGLPVTERVLQATFNNSQPASYRLRGTVTLFQTLTTGARLTVN
jgi:hypothetical protein